MNSPFAHEVRPSGYSVWAQWDASISPKTRHAHRPSSTTRPKPHRCRNGCGGESTIAAEAFFATVESNDCAACARRNVGCFAHEAVFDIEEEFAVAVAVAVAFAAGADGAASSE